MDAPEPDELPPLIDLDMAIEWLQLRCQRISCSELWILYSGADRRIGRYERFLEGEHVPDEPDPPGESSVVVYLEGPPIGLPTELIAIDSLVSNRGRTDSIAIGATGEVWNRRRAMEAFEHRNAQWEVVLKGPYGHLRGPRSLWIEAKIREEQAEKARAAGGAGSPPAIAEAPARDRNPVTEERYAFDAVRVGDEWVPAKGRPEAAEPGTERARCFGTVWRDHRTDVIAESGWVIPYPKDER